MTALPRLRPDPIPAIHPLPEYLAEGWVKDRYEDMRTVFQVPWMGVVTMAYAHYPTFYDAFWTGLRPLCASRPFVEAFQDLRAFVEEGVAELNPPPITERLTGIGYAAREIANIRDMIEVFSHGNFPYVVIAAITRMLLEGGEMGTATAAPAFEGRHAPDVQVPFLLMEAHHVDAPTRELYEDIKATLKLPFVNTDYRAFARWPSYFHLAWGDLRTVAGGPEHERFVQTVHERAVHIATTLPNPGGLTGAALRAAAEKDAPLAEVLEMSRLFQWLLPGLVTNVAYFRHQFH